MTENFQKQELSILRKAVDKAEKQLATKNRINSEQTDNMISILEDYLRKHQLICYGGTAINNILPVEDQFYNKDIDIPDYDVFSPDALDVAKDLADLYYRNGYTDVEAKSGIHEGTYKLFVNFIPIADITYQVPEIYNAISSEAIIIDGILYAPPNYLRMAMYLELSRPAGDVGRWEKVLKRLILLNKHYPMLNPKCNSLNFMRSFDDNVETSSTIYNIVKNSLIDQGAVFFGGFAATLYGKYMPKNERKQLDNNPDFDVLSIDPERTAIIVKERLEAADIKHINIHKKDDIGEIIPEHFEIKVGDETVAFIYSPTACHSFNKIRLGSKTVKIATIDTMLSFFLTFIYSDRPYYDRERILCMAQYLFYVQSKNRLKQKGLLKRFSISCYGEQATIADIRAKKAQKYRFLSDKKHDKQFHQEYEKLFLKYSPEFNKNKTLRRKIKSKEKPKEKHKERSTDKKKRKDTNKKLDTEILDEIEGRYIDTSIVEEIIEDIDKINKKPKKRRKRKGNHNKTRRQNDFLDISVPKEYWVLN